MLQHGVNWILTVQLFHDLLGSAWISAPSQGQRSQSLGVATGSQRHSRGCQLMSLGSIAEFRFSYCFIDLPECSGFSCAVPLGRFHSLSGQFSRLSQSAVVGLSVGINGEQPVLTSRLANRGGHLLLHG